MHFPLARSGDSAYGAWIRYATQNGTALAGTNYTAASGAIQVPASSSTVSIPVQILGASSYSTNKQFTLKLLSAVGVGPTPAFATQQTLSTGIDPDSVTTVDVNGDGKPDLIVANNNSNTVSVLLNTTTPGATTPSFGRPGPRSSSGFAALRLRRPSISSAVPRMSMSKAMRSHARLDAADRVAALIEKCARR